MTSRSATRRLGALLTCLALTSQGCRDLTDPALPGNATPLTPPAVYARWWAMTEQCSGHSADFGAVSFYVATGSFGISAGSQTNLAGYYSGASNRIVFADTAYLDGAVIRHEMLHAILGAGVQGHPRDQFLGRCLGVVTCEQACISDAGPAGPADPAAQGIDASALRISGVVDPVSPNRGIDDGWFTFTISVTNPRTVPVLVSLEPSGDAGPPVSVSWTDERPGPDGGTYTRYYDYRALDAASVARFAAGETKRFVIDFQAGRTEGVRWGMAPGPHALQGFYNGRALDRASAKVSVQVQP